MGKRPRLGTALGACLLNTPADTGLRDPDRATREIKFQSGIATESSASATEQITIATAFVSELQKSWWAQRSVVAYS
jgi:hypothetical protein